MKRLINPNVCHLKLELMAMKYNEEQKLYMRSQLILEQFGLSEKSHPFPMQLSGDHQQRLAIARSLILASKVTHEPGLSKLAQSQIWFATEEL